LLSRPSGGSFHLRSRRAHLIAGAAQARYPTHSRGSNVWDVRVLSDANLGRGKFQPGILLYIPTSVSWWNGDIHLPFCFCQSEVAITFPACFLPLQVTSWVAV